jgi:branched-chain amino acid transport system substrate-binding protein
MKGAHHRQHGIAHCCAKVLVLTALVSLGCGVEEPIRIGFLAGTSGRVADAGISSRDAAQMAIEHCNQSGGVSGRRVRLIVKDDQDRPDVAREAVQDLIDKGVAAIIGPITSHIALAVLPSANEAKVLVLSPTVAGDALSGKDDLFFRVAPTTRDYATRSATFLFESRRMRRAAAVYDLSNRAYTESWVEGFKRAFHEAGGELIATIGFDARTDRTFLEIAGELLAARPDGILIVANSMDSALLCQQIRKLDSRMEIALSDWGATERLLELGGKAVEGVTLVQSYDPREQNLRYRTFRKAYMERYHREPGPPAVNTYDAVQVILAALRSQKRGQPLHETILSIERFEGLQGDFGFDRFGDALRPRPSITIVRDRQFIALE